MLSKHKELLLAILAVLSLLKFILVPWYQQQQEQLDDLAISSQRLAKVKALQQIEQPMQLELERLNTQKNQFIEHVPKATDHKSIALKVQSEFEQLFEQHQLRLESFEWQGYQPLGIPNLHQGRIQLRAAGKLSAMGLSMLQIEQKNQYLNVQQAKITGSPIDKSDDLSLAITLDLLYLLEQPRAE
jgi:hypothetical protein